MKVEKAHFSAREVLLEGERVLGGQPLRHAVADRVPVDLPRVRERRALGRVVVAAVGEQEPDHALERGLERLGHPVLRAVLRGEPTDLLLDVLLARDERLGPERRGVHVPEHERGDLLDVDHHGVPVVDKVGVVPLAPEVEVVDEGDAARLDQRVAVAVRDRVVHDGVDPEDPPERRDVARQRGGQRAAQRRQPLAARAVLVGLVAQDNVPKVAERVLALFALGEALVDRTQEFEHFSNRFGSILWCTDDGGHGLGGLR